MLLEDLGENKGVCTVTKGFSLKVKAAARLEFELAYFEAAVKRLSHYVTKTTLKGYYIEKRIYKYI